MIGMVGYICKTGGLAAARDRGSRRSAVCRLHWVAAATAAKRFFRMFSSVTIISISKVVSMSHVLSNHDFWPKLLFITL